MEVNISRKHEVLVYAPPDLSVIYCNYCVVAREITGNAHGVDILRKGFPLTKMCPSHNTTTSPQCPKCVRQCITETTGPQYDNSQHISICSIKQCNVPSSLKCAYPCEECIIWGMRGTLNNNETTIR